VIAVGVFLVISIGACWAGPRLLTMGRWQVLHPRVALAAWHGAMAIGLSALIAAVSAAVALTLSAQQAPDEASTVAQTVVGWGALVGVSAALAVIGAGSDHVITSGRHMYGEVLALPHSVAPLDRRTSLVTCRTDEPFACAIPGQRDAVVVSSGLCAILTPAQLAAVVAHERAHLTGRHYVALRLAEVNRACVPALRSGTQLLSATKLLSELIADDYAARRVGAVHLANALARVADRTQDVGMELRAERLTGRRWAPARKLATAGYSVFDS
jgi:Zn-dependent protease with chaperone function